jgi:hypothetical protein
MGTFRKFLFIPYSRRPAGGVVNQEKMGIFGRKIFPCSSRVKGKLAGWIFLDNSSCDEYYQVSKEIGGHSPDNCTLIAREGKMGRTVSLSPPLRVERLSSPPW